MDYRKKTEWWLSKNSSFLNCREIERELHLKTGILRHHIKRGRRLNDSNIKVLYFFICQTIKVWKQ